MSTRFTLFYRENCHLCESMQLALSKLRKKLDFDWQAVDIDRDTDLIKRYDVLVPVLCNGDEEVCHHFIDEVAIRSYCGAD